MEDNLKIIRAKDFDPKNHERQEIFHDRIEWVNFSHTYEGHRADHLIVVREKPKAWTVLHNDEIGVTFIKYKNDLSLHVNSVTSFSAFDLDASLEALVNHLNETEFELDKHEEADEDQECLCECHYIGIGGRPHTERCVTECCVDDQ